MTLRVGIEKSQPPAGLLVMRGIMDARFLLLLKNMHMHITQGAGHHSFLFHQLSTGERIRVELII